MNPNNGKSFSIVISTLNKNQNSLNKNIRVPNKIHIELTLAFLCFKVLLLFFKKSLPIHKFVVKQNAKQTEEKPINK